jgi:alanine racemase
MRLGVFMLGSRGLGPAIATIDLGALRANAAEAARLAGGRALIGVVKADAYGHGATPVARALVDAGVSMLAAWSVGEAASLRDAGVESPLLVLLGPRDDSEADEAAGREFACVLHDAVGREMLAGAARRRGAAASVHVEVDSGMRRMGVPGEEAAEFISQVAAAPELSLAGVMTHFARADEADLTPTREQLRRFAEVLAALRARGVDPGRVHAANSAGLVAQGDLAGEAPPQDAVRPGLLFYGVQPSGHRRAALRPVMSVRAPVVAIRRVRAGEPVGYSARYRASEDTRIATLGIGYADGVPISTTGTGAVWLAGARRPIAGRVSMDYLTVEIGRTPVQVGDEAVIFGCEAAGDDPVLPVEEAAEAAGTISYELLVRVGARVRRSYTDGDTSV